MINYYELGGRKQLNEVVFAGSHDAGITSGSSSVQTQSLDILGQAQAGVRLFDLRIAAATVAGKTDGAKNAQLRAFHADGMLKKDQTASRYLPELGRTETVTRTKLRGGGFGMGLEQILDDAKGFVTGSTEFLLLKFDKCTNWELIAETCVGVLGNALYKGSGNLNKKTLYDLRGYVVVLFTPSGLRTVQHAFRPGSGILGIRNLGGDDGTAAYDDDYNGLQYFGKGGTSPFNTRKKTSQNEKKQAKLMERGGHGNPDVMGMMYWTTTGLTASIQKRNQGLWSAPNKARMLTLWSNGLQASLKSAVPKNIDLGSFSSGAALKAFMPNFVMIDFADETKCQTIYDLNTVAGNQLVQLEQEFVQLDEDL